jgi:hypothetical protein
MEFRARFLIVADAIQIIGIEQDVMRIEAGIETFRETEAADEKSRTDKQKQGHSDLRDDKDAGEARLAPSATGAAGFFL